jgi:hypothetical protein
MAQVSDYPPEWRGELAEFETLASEQAAAVEFVERMLEI